MSRFASFVVALLFLFPALAHAGDQGDPDQACDGNTVQMAECIAAKTAQWDKRMNAAYQQALKDAATPAQHDQLRNAQRLWVQYRDASCQYYAMGEGTISRIDAAECLRRTTETRARELESLGHQ